MVDTDTQLITAVAVLPGNAPDNLGSLELVEESEANTGVALGDAAYGDGDTRRAFADAGRTLIARVPGRPNRKHFPKDDFRIDLNEVTCTCPAGRVTRKLLPAGKRTGSHGTDSPVANLPVRRGSVRGMPTAAPVRGRIVREGANGATAPAGGPVAAGLRLAAE